MKDQPKIDIPVSSVERMIDAAAILFASSALLLAFYYYSSLPDQVPSHFNYKGEVDGHGSKNFIFLLPVLAIAMALGFIYLAGFPNKFNYLKKITPDNAAYEYHRTRFMVRVLNVFTSLLLFVITWETIQGARGAASNLSGLFWVAVVAVLVGPLAVYLGWPKQVKAS